ncbi:MAG: chemotaxis protein CheX [Desulfobacterales bacterium]|nr:chemotaxis protein CheX [Desulfobacterales bacterium]
MDATIINPFIKAALHTLNTLGHTKLHKTDIIYLKKDQTSEGDISGVIEVNGDIAGTVSISFPEKSILKIVSRMFSEEMTVLNEEIQDAVGEITSTTAGQASQNLLEIGKTAKTKLKTVLMGKKHTIPHNPDHKTVAILFRGNDKIKFIIEACFIK